jgi:2-keto-4-pentenoate hydratase/2-oxohepta-3-ene-1,7-dioic acid hydratase in catechol pathway
VSDYGRILLSGRPTWVVARDGEIRPLAAAPWECAEPEPASRPIEAAGCTWLAPTVPSKIMAIGRSYAEHAREHGADPPKEPLLFLKAPSALLAPGHDVVLPPESQQVEHEGELAMVFSRRFRRFRPEDDLAGVVLGYTTADDVTARDLQRRDGQWARGKSFDTFCPLAALVRSDAPARDAVIETRVNGVARQRATLSDLVFSLEALVAHVSAAMTIEPGDVLLTGTPAGVGPLRPGDRVVVTVDGLPALEHGVRSERA